MWISPDFFDTDLRPLGWTEDPDLRRAVDWFRSFMSSHEWHDRRFAALEYFLTTATGEAPPQAVGPGRFFSEIDQFGWYLFLAQAKLEHPTVYDTLFGSRVVPVMTAIGRNLDLLKSVQGVEERVQRLVGKEKRQPNGGLFELLVAAAYRREGGIVRFLPETPGVAKTHDMDVNLHGRELAVECKRMELGDYTERERAEARELWLPTAHELQERGHSVLARVAFTLELEGISREYLAEHSVEWLRMGANKPHRWKDARGAGSIEKLDLQPLKSSLQKGSIAMHGSLIMSLLTGKYKRNASYVQVLGVHTSDNPLYVEDCDQALVLDWESHSEAAIDGKARDVLRRLSDAVKQLPADRHGIVHIGLEAVDGDDVEKRRFEKISNTVSNFDAEGKPLAYVLVNWFSPESPPYDSEAFDETCFVHSTIPGGRSPLNDNILVGDPRGHSRAGVHWDERKIRE